MPLPQMCLCFLVRADGESTYVLLGKKKRGLGSGNVVGLGGKVEVGEDARQAAVREIAEEAGVLVDADDLAQRASIRFHFPSRPSWDQQASVFVASRWTGEPAESDEISPAWYDVNTIPHDAMWDDAQHWLPEVLAGGSLTATFTFGSDLKTLVASDVRLDSSSGR